MKVRTTSVTSARGVTCDWSTWRGHGVRGDRNRRGTAVHGSKAGPVGFKNRRPSKWSRITRRDERGPWRECRGSPHLRCWLRHQRHLDHRSGQVVGRNDLVGKHHPEHRVDCAQQTIAHIGLPTRLHGVNVGRAKQIETGKSRGEERSLGLALVASERQPTTSVGSAPATVEADPNGTMEILLGCDTIHE